MRKSLLFLFALMCSAALNAVTTTKIVGKVNSSSIEEGAEIILLGPAEIFMDVNRTLATIKGDFDLIVSGDRTLIIKSSGHGISVGSLTVLSASLEVSSKKDALNIDRAIMVDGGKLNLSANGDAIYSRKSGINMFNATVNCTCGTNMSAIYTPNGSINISDCNVVARGAKYGIYAEGGSVKLSGNVTATAGGWAIVAETDIELKGGSIIARSSGTPVSAKKDIVIEADLNATALGDGASGIYAGGGLMIKSGYVVSDCSDNGTAIGANGVIALEGGKVEAYGAKYGIYSKTSYIKIQAPLYCKGAGWAIWAEAGIALNYPYVLHSPTTAILASNSKTYMYGSQPAHELRFGFTPLQGGVIFSGTANQTLPVMQTAQCLLTGEANTLQKEYGVSFNFTWQVSDDGETNWTDVQTNSDSWFIPAEYLGKIVRVRATSPDCDGVLISNVARIAKAPCSEPVVQAVLKVEGTKLYLENPKPNQEYILYNSYTNIEYLTSYHWTSENRFVPEQTTRMELTQAKPNATQYLYTRVRETNLYKAGEDVRVSYAYTGTPTYLQGIALSAQQVDNYGNVGPLTAENRSYYTKVNSVVKVTATAIPDGATNYNGIHSSHWINNSNGGTYYVDYKCTQTLQDGSYYKVVYFKPTKKSNNCDIAAEFTKGYNDIAHDAINLYVADASGKYYATTVNSDPICVVKGNRLAGIKLQTRPSLASTSDFVFTLNSGTGTAPTVKAETDGTITVDATNATKGTYYYNITQGTNSVGNGLSVQVTNAVIEQVSVEPENIIVEPGDEFQLITNLFPANTGDDITYSSSNTGVATVSNTGYVKINANAPLAQTVIVTAKAGGKSAQCVITVDGIEFDAIVDGTQISTLNMADILGNGAFSFDGIRTLTVNADYSASSQLIISNIDGLVINVEKDVALTGNAVILNLTKNTTITGKGTLSATNNSGPAIVVNNNAELSVVSANLNANGGISGSKTGNPRLSIEASSVTATAADSRGAIYNFRGGISLADCVITLPADGKIDEATGNIVNSEGSVADNVVIQSTASDLETVPVYSQSQAQKILKDGKLYICLPNGKIYNALGSEMK